MKLSTEELHARAKRVRLILLDVDGVLTDGTVTIHGSGSESKPFFIRDGAAIVWARRAGLEVGLLSGRRSAATSRRATELGITIVSQAVADKRQGYADLLAAHGYADPDVAYMADDLLDLPVLARAGVSACPADADQDVQSRVHWVSRYDGGRGAVREFIEMLFRARGQWDGLVASFLES